MSSLTHPNPLSSMRTLIAIVVVAALAAAVWMPATASADFGLEPGSVTMFAEEANGSLDLRASSHPFSYVVHFALKTDESGLSEGGAPRNILVEVPPGLVGNPQATPTCPRPTFEAGADGCGPSTQIGVLRAIVAGFGEVNTPIYNLVPPPGVAAQFGVNARAAGLQSLQNLSLRTESGEGVAEYGVNVFSPHTPVEITSVTETIWGAPADPGHTPVRGPDASGGGFASEAPQLAYLTLPADCSKPPAVTVKVDSVANPGVYSSESAVMESAGHPASLVGCGSVPFEPTIGAAPTTTNATSSSGLEFELRLPDDGLLAPGAIAETEPRKIEVALPTGVSANPSAAETLSTCSEAQFRAETLTFAPGAGCPDGSKLGSVTAKSPLLDELFQGSLFLATPYENPGGGLLGIYLVLRGPERGVLIKQWGKIAPDPTTGQLTTTIEGLPPVPYSDVNIQFREGARGVLVTPPTCGTYTTTANLYPFSAPDSPTTRTAIFRVKQGVNGGSCPSGGTPPFHPNLLAGSINNAAGSYSPFDVEISRTDGEQEITHFSIKLPPGVSGKLAGIPFCSNADITAAKGRERQPHGGQEELDHPSCPQASEIGHTLVGAGVGGVLTYVPGKVYLAGPYNGSNLSVVAVTAAKAGPFDLGTVVVREALRVNPETAEVFVDATGSDAIPHIIDGIPVHLRDIRVYVDRPEFALNPTNCKRTSTASTVLGSGTDFASESDDRPVTVTSPFQAADCASLVFKPKLTINLQGGTTRSANPRLKAVVTAKKGESNIGEAQVTLPHSEFLEQGHIKTVCTRVQFNAGGGNGEQCPAASIYGRASAVTPLLSETLSGPVYLRSSSHKLPDMIAALHSGTININLDGRIDSSKGGRISAAFEGVPDAPVSKFTLEMFGGKKSLLVNSTNICKGTFRAESEFTGQNGKVYDTKPVVKAQCGKKGKRSAGKKKGAKRILALSSWQGW